VVLSLRGMRSVWDEAVRVERQALERRGETSLINDDNKEEAATNTTNVGTPFP